MAKPKGTGVSNYTHSNERSPMRPEIGVQGRFKKRKPPQKYRYDSSLSPALDWDGQNAAREQGEALIRQILQADSLDEAKLAAEKLKALGRPFLDWAGKAERLSFDVPTLPLFIHERLSTRGIIETLKGHKRDRQNELFDLFGDPKHSIADQVTKAYEYQDEWRNRVILGDSLVVMNSLLHWDQLGGKVQMIYLDPPYGVKFGSNFQPFVRKRDVKHNDDTDMTREPEMVQAYRDTWELGLHSYLTYLRDRLLLARELLTPSGSIFVQISDENLHHVRELMDDVFGVENFVVTILIKKKGSQKGELIDPVNDYLVWYARDIKLAKTHFHQLYTKAEIDKDLLETFRYVELSDGRELTLSDLSKISPTETNYSEMPERIFQDFPGAKLFTSENITSGGYRRTQSVIFHYKRMPFDPGIERGNCWKHSAITDDGSPSGMDNLASSRRLFVGDKQLRYKRYANDFGYKAISNWWDGLGGAAKPVYVVQTNPEIVKRCILMTTYPGDLVLDPTSGSGTTAYVAEQWGRRWITIDASRVPLALARQRLLTETFPYFELNDESQGPASGFVYKRKQNRKGEEIGGIVPHITSSTIANDEPPVPEVIVDRPEVKSNIVRVTGPFTFEATIPTPLNAEMETPTAPGAESDGGDSFIGRMIEVLRKSPVLRLDGKRTVTFKNVRQPAKTLWLSAEANIEGNGSGEKPVAVVFGPENGAVSERLVQESSREAYMKGYAHLYVIGFAIQPNARALIESSAEMGGVTMTYVQATLDLLMGDLLKNMRSSQVFSVCGLPEIKLSKGKKDGATIYQVELLGLDVFDPVTMEVEHRKGNDVPVWLLDTDYNGNCFHVSQAFFPRTSAWDNLKKSLKGYYEEDVWSHLAGTVSAPFAAGDERRIAVKVIDDRGNELMVVKELPKGGGAGK